MTAARTVIGPLTTTFTQPGYCGNVVVACPYSCDSGWQAQDCVSDPNYSYQAQDATSCWPPASSGAPTPTPPFAGWGFYSPGTICPSGWTSACSATAGGATGWVQGFSMLPGETAVGCCPSGYVCGAQTCSSVAQRGGTVPVVTCSNGLSQGYSYLTIPATVTVTGISSSASRVAEIEFSSFGVQAPMIEIRWQSSDRPKSTSAPTAADSSSDSSGLSTGTKVAIGVLVPVAVIAILAGIFFFWRRKIRKLGENSWAEPSSTAGFRHSDVQPSPGTQQSQMEVRAYHKNVDGRGQYISPPRELDASPQLQELEGSKTERVRNR